MLDSSSRGPVFIDRGTRGDLRACLRGDSVLCRDGVFDPVASTNIEWYQINGVSRVLKGYISSSMIFSSQG